MEKYGNSRRPCTGWLMQHDNFMRVLETKLADLGMTQSKVDSSLFYKVENGEVIGALITHIDDFMHCGNESFDETVMKPLHSGPDYDFLGQKSFKA